VAAAGGTRRPGWRGGGDGRRGQPGWACGRRMPACQVLPLESRVHDTNGCVVSRRRREHPTHLLFGFQLVDFLSVFRKHLLILLQLLFFLVMLLNFRFDLHQCRTVDRWLQVGKRVAGRNDVSLRTERVRCRWATLVAHGTRPTRNFPTSHNAKVHHTPLSPLDSLVWWRQRPCAATCPWRQPASRQWPEGESSASWSTSAGSRASPSCKR
jgi:hypothetical protein